MLVKVKVIKRSPIRCGIGGGRMETEEMVVTRVAEEGEGEQMTGGVIKWCGGCERCGESGCPRGRMSFSGAVRVLQRAYRNSLM